MNLRPIAAVLVALVVLVAALAGALSLYADSLYRDSYESTYTYDVRFSTNETLTDVTLYVPLPSLDGEPFADTARLERVNVTRDDLRSIVGVTEPSPPIDFDPTVVETEFGPMLRLTADRIAVSTVYYRVVENGTMGYHERIDRSEYDPANRSMGVAHDGYFDITVTVALDRSVETRDPSGVEPVPPMENQQTVECSSRITDEQRCYTYDGRAFVDFDANETAETSLSMWFTGGNYWWVFGWSGNEYRHFETVEMTGPQDGWVATRGELVTGWGDYR